MYLPVVHCGNLKLESRHIKVRNVRIDIRVVGCEQQASSADVLSQIKVLRAKPWQKQHTAHSQNKRGAQRRVLSKRSNSFWSRIRLWCSFISNSNEKKEAYCTQTTKLAQLTASVTSAETCFNCQYYQNKIHATENGKKSRRVSEC